jgi:hypothetical protein
VTIRHKFCKTNSPATYVTDMPASQELFKLIDRKNNLMWWKVGKYSVQIIPHSPKKFELVESSFDFELSDNDLDHIKENINFVDVVTRDVIRGDATAFIPAQIAWRWSTVALTRKDDV